jgi:8-oxo-dGTP pyrophosphatase MutT (NUDIX family)
MIKNHGVVVLIRHDKKFLLLKDSRELMLDHWAPPHGRCDESDENEKATVVRETFEETNLQVIPLKKIWEAKADTKVKTVAFWLAEVISGEIKIDEQESSEYGWFTLDEALALKLYPGTKKFFVLVKQGDITI